MLKIATDGDYQGPRTRLHYIISRIQEDDCPSASKLAKLCGVSSKTIQRDLQYLQNNMGAPLRYDESKKGWTLDQPGFFLPMTFASETDLQAIMTIGVMVSQYSGTPLGNAMKPAFERILTVFRNENIEALKSLTKKICFASQPQPRIGEQIWGAVLIALERTQKLLIGYRAKGSEPEKCRVYDSYGLIVRNRDWFLHGFSHDDNHRQTLYLPYVTSAKLLDEYFDVPEDFDLSTYAETGFQGLHTQGAKPEKVVLQLTPEAAAKIDISPFARDQQLETAPNGEFATLVFETTALFQVAREVLSWGDQVEVLGPPSLRQTINTISKNMAKKYK